MKTKLGLWIVSTLFLLSCKARLPSQLDEQQQSLSSEQAFFQNWIQRQIPGKEGQWLSAQSVASPAKLWRKTLEGPHVSWQWLGTQPQWNDPGTLRDDQLVFRAEIKTPGAYRLYLRSRGGSENGQIKPAQFWIKLDPLGSPSYYISRPDQWISISNYGRNSGFQWHEARNSQIGAFPMVFSLNQGSVQIQVKGRLPQSELSDLVLLPAEVSAISLRSEQTGEFRLHLDGKVLEPRIDLRDMQLGTRELLLPIAPRHAQLAVESVCQDPNQTSQLSYLRIMGSPVYPLEQERMLAVSPENPINQGLSSCGKLISFGHPLFRSKKAQDTDDFITGFYGSLQDDSNQTLTASLDVLNRMEDLKLQFVAPYIYSLPDEQILSYLDLAAARGLKVLFQINDPVFIKDTSKATGYRAIKGKGKLSAEEWLKKFANHPAIFAWAIADEPFYKVSSLAERDNRKDPGQVRALWHQVKDSILSAADLIHSLDPKQRPAFVVAYRMDNEARSWLREISPYVDILSWDLYRFNLGQREFAPLAQMVKVSYPILEADYQALNNQFWLVPQAQGNRAPVNDDPNLPADNNGLRLPTRQEHRFQVFYPLIRLGSPRFTGQLFFATNWTLNAEARPEEAYPYDGKTWLWGSADPSQPNWQNSVFGHTQNLLQRFQRSIASGSLQDISPSKDAEGLTVRTRLYLSPKFKISPKICDSAKASYVIMAINESAQAVSKDFRLPEQQWGLGQAELINAENNKLIKLQGESWTESFAPYELKIYELRYPSCPV